MIIFNFIYEWRNITICQYNFEIFFTYVKYKLMNLLNIEAEYVSWEYLAIKWNEYQTTLRGITIALRRQQNELHYVMDEAWVI